MLVIAVANAKGGVGKTTIATSLAVAAAEDGRRVALVDLDPQGSTRDWHARRAIGNPTLFTGADYASDALEKLRLHTAIDAAICDGPPGSLNVTNDLIAAADLVVIPTRASVFDLASMLDAVRLCVDRRRPYCIVFNDVSAGDRGLVKAAREAVLGAGIPEANVVEGAIAHRVAFANAATTGRTGAEIDDKAAAEIEALWGEIKRRTRGAKRKG